MNLSSIIKKLVKSDIVAEIVEYTDYEVNVIFLNDVFDLELEKEVSKEISSRI